MSSSDSISETALAPARAHSAKCLAGDGATARASHEVSSVKSLPQLLLAYYGDDFSGSADVMESLALAGLHTVLFLEPPTLEVLARYEGVRAIGLAGVSRSMSPAAMDSHLPAAFASLRQLGAPLVHYKICSTFDSSSSVGSIGRAIEIGLRSFRSKIVPIVVGVPVLGRYVVFGNLFARSGLDSPVYRLDRHPTMSQHPTTPMQESDLQLVLADQTSLSTGLVDLSHLAGGYESVRNQLEVLMKERASVVLFDTAVEADLPLIGRAIWELATEGRATGAAAEPFFVVGSSGVEYALRAFWRESGMIAPCMADFLASRQEQILCVSGSCSPVTARQIEYALERGFVEIAVDPRALLEPQSTEKAVREIVADSQRMLRDGRSVIVHTSRGPHDQRIAVARQALRGDASSAALFGNALGAILRSVIEATGLQRVAVTGGDTSGFVARRLGIEALELVAPIAPGSPLCRIHSRPADQVCHGTEIALKGGQVGHADYLVQVRDGVV